MNGSGQYWNLAMVVVFVQWLSHVWLSATPRTAALEASLSFTIWQWYLNAILEGILNSDGSAFGINFYIIIGPRQC